MQLYKIQYKYSVYMIFNSQPTKAYDALSLFIGIIPGMNF